MKKRLANKLLFVVCILFFGSMSESYAAENSNTVDPNVYKEKEITIYRHYDKTDEEKTEIHEDLADLTFKRETIREKDKILHDLFQTTSESGKNTILAKASKLNLFSNDYTTVEKSDVIDERGNVNYLNILLIIIFALTIMMLIFLIPKLNEANNK